MKNLLVVAVTVALAWLVYDAMQPAPSLPRPILVAATPLPPPLPAKLYFHSALDAPAMSTHESTGYFSTDQGSRFNALPNLGSGGTTYLNNSSTTVYLAAPASPGSASTASAGVNRSLVTPTTVRSEGASRLPRQLLQPTPAPVGVAR